MATLTKHESRKRRHRRVRKKIVGTPDKPRLCVVRTNKHVEAQLIDDVEGHTLVSVNTRQPEMKQKSIKKNTSDGTVVGERLATKALEKGLDKAVFDRAGFKFHGVIKAVADGCRENGLKL